VNELTANPEEPGRHLFEIMPGEKLFKSSLPYSETSIITVNMVSE